MAKLARRMIVWILFILFTVGAVVVGRHLTRLAGDLEPDIVAFELAGDEAESNRILQAWQKRGQTLGEDLLGIAEKQIRWDYLFLFLYPTAIALGCLLAHRPLSEVHGTLGAAALGLAFLQVLTAACDAGENRALSVILANGGAVAPLPQLAALLARLKFGLVFAGFTVVLLGVGVVVFRWARLLTKG